MNAKERTQELLKLSEVFAERSKVHWDGFVDSCGSQGATFGKWKPVFLRDMRDIWRDEFPTTEGWRAIRKVIIDPMLEHIAREHVKPGECTVLAKHATIGQAIAIAADQRL